MLLYLKRETPILNATPGKLYIDGEYFCFTLEDLVRLPDVKLYGQTAIPVGEYFVHLNYSPRFGRILPQVINVPMFTGIRIHKGNRVGDTLGCILVGFRRDKDVIWESTIAEESLMSKLTEASKCQVLAITIEEADAPLV